MSIRKKELKIELILLVCFVFLFFRALPAVKEERYSQKYEQEQQTSEEKKDEQVSGSMLVVEYAAGNEKLLKKESGITIPTPTLAPTPLPTVTPLPTYVPAPEDIIRVADLIGTKYVLEDLLDLTYLKDNFYIVNATTKMTENEFDVEYFVEKDLSIEKTSEPQILIYHTHGSEAFSDSRAGETEDTITGIGEILAEILREKYGYQVIHDTTLFDRKDGKDNRNYAYNDALDYMEAFLKEHSSIEVIIDLHRDAGTKRVVTVNGKQTAKVMLFNGLCRNTKGKLTYLPNENLADNLAFSFQMKLIGDEMYPGLMNRIFLKDYRYNMHLAERYLLIELGTEQNTVEEAKNAMEPLADVLAQVLGR